jgi:hypothetical protein
MCDHFEISSHFRSHFFARNAVFIFAASLASYGFHNLFLDQKIHFMSLKHKLILRFGIFSNYYSTQFAIIAIELPNLIDFQLLSLNYSLLSYT